MNYEEVGQQPLSLMSKPLFEILENGDNTVDLGDDMSDSFINIRLRNIIKNYNNNTEQFEFYSNYYRMAKCEEKDFQRNEFEQGYWSQYNGRSQYCVQDEKPFLKTQDSEDYELTDNFENAYMQGTRDSLLFKQSHAYVIFEAWRCNEQTKQEETVCKTADEIDEWTSTKLATLKVINQKIDFLDYDEEAVRNNEIFIRAVDMSPGHYSDTGYRFRFNRFDRQDGWFLPTPSINPFFDFMYYSSDTYPTPPSSTPDMISEFYIRL